MPAFLIPLLGWAAKLVSTAWLTPLVGIVTGIAKLGGAIIGAIAEIVVAMSKSPEGRILLAAIVIGAGLLYGRHHYIAQGRAEQRPVSFAAGVAHGKTLVKCPAPAARRK